MYKSKDKRTQASKERMRRYRALHPVQNKPVTPLDVTPPPVIPVTPDRSSRIAQALCELPSDIVESINLTVHNRVIRGMSDDRGDRLVRALEYQEWYSTRLTNTLPLCKLL